MYVINCLLYFILGSFTCQASSFTLPPPQFPCSHLLTTVIKVSKQYWHWVWQPIKVLPNTQYYPILENIGQYPIPQCQYRSNPTRDPYKIWHTLKHISKMSKARDFKFGTLVHVDNFSKMDK